MDGVPQAPPPSIAPADTSSSSIRERVVSSSNPVPSQSISSPVFRSHLVSDETAACSISCSAASTLQSQPAAPPNSPQQDEAAPGTNDHQRAPQRAANTEIVSIFSSSSDRDRRIDIPDANDDRGLSKGARSFTERARWLPLPQTPVAGRLSNAAELLLTDWNESPFVSSYHGPNEGKEAGEDQSEEWSSVGSPWHIEIGKVEMGEMVASGSFGMVYKGLYKDEKVAVKMLLIPESSSSKESRRLKSGFRQEIDVWYTLKHPNIVQFIGAYVTPPKWAIVTEFLHGGSLRAYLVRQHRKKLPHKTIQAMALDIARGMEYLHRNNIMHRDLKSANLLLDEYGRVKVTDFGLARFDAEDPGNLTAETGTIRWMAPEVICHMPYTRKIDVYSFGIVMWELCTSLLPFEGMSFVQLAHAVANDNHRPPTSEVSSSTFRKLMVRCWDKDATRRPEFSDIVKELETNFSANLGSKAGTKALPKSSRSQKLESVDTYRRPTVSLRGGRAVGRTHPSGPALVANNEDELTDEEEWLNVRRQCRCTIT